MGMLTGRRFQFMPRGESLAWLGAWSLIYAANLPLPLALGHSEATTGGTGGMYLAILCLWALGVCGCLRSRKLTICLITGGFVVALFQFFPMPQIMAGMVGLSIAHGMVPDSLRGNTPLGTIAHGSFGLIATLVTGGLLMSAAAFVGSLFLVFVPGHSPRTAKEASPPPGGVFDKQLDG